VATQYLHNYLSWHLFDERTSGLQPAAAGQQLLVDAGSVLRQARGGGHMSSGRAA